jgi:poly(hydroxyalkanoate) depolymerase family esterase
MKAPLLDMIAKVTTLTRGRRLQEATDLIRQALVAPVASTAPEPSAPPSTHAAHDESLVLDGLTRVVPEPLSDVVADDFTAKEMATQPATAPVAPAEPDSAPMQRAAATGRFVSGVFANGAGSRPYKLYIPDGVQDAPRPLLVMLHGCTQHPDDFATGTRMNEWAQAAHCFVLYPAQPQSANNAGCWNWFNAADQQRDRGEPSILAGMTRQVIAEHAIDAARVYVAGLSAGGAMAATMGETYPDLFAAVGVHSGLPHAAAHDIPSAFTAMRKGAAGSRASATKAVPTIVFHGDRDTTVHPCNGEMVAERAAGVAGSDALAGSRERVQNASGRAYTRTTQRDATGQPQVEHWLVHGSAHAWSGGSAEGSYTDPKGPDASAEMLRFFLVHPKG